MTTTTTEAKKKPLKGRRVGRKQQQAEMDDRIDLQHILRHWNYRHKKFSRNWDDDQRQQYELGDFAPAAETGGLHGSTTANGLPPVDGSPPLPQGILEGGADMFSPPSISSLGTTIGGGNASVEPFEYRDEGKAINFIQTYYDTTAILVV